MAEVIKIGSTASVGTTPTTVELIGSGAFEKAQFWVQTTGAATAGTWTVALQWKSPGGVVDTIASEAAIDGTATALVPIAIDGAFDGAPLSCIPRPNRLVITRTGGTGPFTGEIWAAFAGG